MLASQGVKKKRTKHSWNMKTKTIPLDQKSKDRPSPSGMDKTIGRILQCQEEPNGFSEASRSEEPQ